MDKIKFFNHWKLFFGISLSLQGLREGGLGDGVHQICKLKHVNQICKLKRNKTFSTKMYSSFFETTKMKKKKNQPFLLRETHATVNSS